MPVYQEVILFCVFFNYGMLAFIATNIMEL